MTGSHDPARISSEERLRSVFIDRFKGREYKYAVCRPTSEELTESVDLKPQLLWSILLPKQNVPLTS